MLLCGLIYKKMGSGEMHYYQMILVEDDDQIRNGLSRFFPWEQLGFTMVACFENGLKALQYVRENAVDVILTDVRMPVTHFVTALNSKIDGWHFCQNTKLV